MLKLAFIKIGSRKISLFLNRENGI